MSIHDGETFIEQLDRVESMADDADGETWDLSENDREALKNLLASHDRMRVALKALLISAVSDGLSPESIPAMRQAREAVMKAEGR